MNGDAHQLIGDEWELAEERRNHLAQVDARGKHACLLMARLREIDPHVFSAGVRSGGKRRPHRGKG